MTKLTTTNAKAADERGVMTYTPLGEQAPIRLSVAICKQLGLCRPTKSGTMPTDSDIMKFMMLCSARRLNPFSGDVFCVGYDDRDLGPTFTLIVGVQTLHKRAELSADFDGMEAGVMASDSDGNIHDLEGAFVPAGFRLVGGWAKVYRKNVSRPFVSRVAFERFDKGRSLWKASPELMIRKVAIAAALREAFPNTNADLFLQDEMRDTVDGTVVSTTTTTESPKPAKDIAGLLRSGRNEPEPERVEQTAEPTLRERLEACQSATEALAIVRDEMDKNPPEEEAIALVYRDVKAGKGW